MFTFTHMKRSLHIYTKLSVAVVMALIINVSYAAMTGKTDDHKNKFDLKNLSAANRLYSLSSLKTATFQYKGSMEIFQQNNGTQMQVQSMIRLEKGNTTYVYPYKYTVKTPKFKTPMAPIIR